jgi:VWFA-related protein
MFSLRHNFLFFAFLFFISAISLSAQPPDKPEIVYTEEVKINISAFDLDGNFAESLKKEDLVINEDGRLHQANIVQHIPAKVLILLDTGGESRVAKDFKTTRAAAKSLIDKLQGNDQIALMQYHDKIELISDWTSDKQQLYHALDKKMNFGSRSRFTAALSEATDFLQKVNTENRHLVLIGDGLDSIANQELRANAIRNLTATNVNFHVLSYTGMESQVVEKRQKSVSGGGRSAVNLPPGASDPNPSVVRGTPIVTINTDRAMIRKIKERGEDLKRSERELDQLSEDTNGIFYLPENAEEMLLKTGDLARNIDSQYVVTYTPKRPLNESPNGEVRVIEVTSKRDNVIVQAKRKLIVVNKS